MDIFARQAQLKNGANSSNSKAVKPFYLTIFGAKSIKVFIMCIIYTFLDPAPLYSECITGKYWGYFPNSGNPKSPIRCVAPPSHPPKIPKFQHTTPLHFAPPLHFTPSLPPFFPTFPTPHPLHFPPLSHHSPSHPKPTIIPFYTPLTPIYPHHSPPTPTKNTTQLFRHFVKFCVRLLVYDIIMI